MSPKRDSSSGPQAPLDPGTLDPLLRAKDLKSLAAVGLPLAMRSAAADRSALCALREGRTRVFASNGDGVVHELEEHDEQFAFYQTLMDSDSAWRVQRMGNEDLELTVCLGGPKNEVLNLWAEILFLKAQALCALSTARRDKTRYERWFETLDSQIRVLERERQKLAMLVNKSESGAVVFDSEYQVRWVNPAMAKRFRQEDNPSALVGRHCKSFCQSDEVCENCPVKHVLETKKVFHHERTHVSGDDTRHYYVSGFPLRSPSAQVEEVFVTIQDLTDLDTLRKSEARYNALFQRSADAMFMADTKTFKILMANKEAYRLTGISEDASPNLTLLQLHPENNQETMRGFYELLAEGKSLDNVEAEVLDGEGNVLTCNMCGGLFDLDGQQVVQVEYRDVTQLRALQQELVRADHLITLGTMNAGIAHEFKNRLAPLRAFSQMLNLPHQDPAKLKSYGPMIVKEVDRLGRLVGDVLDYARPQNPVLEERDLAALFKELVNELTLEYQEQLARGNIRVRVDIPEDVVAPVQVDVDQLRRAYINLFKNSVEACECTDTVEKAIHIQVEVSRTQVFLHMADTGCGIAPNDLKRIFDPFFSTKGPKGTGLGMCITRSLIEANNGNIEISSLPGSGTTVTLTFDYRESKEQAA